MKFRVLEAFAFVLCGVFVVMCTLWLIIAVDRGEYPSAVVALGWVAMFAAMIAMTARARWGKLRVRVSVTARGTTIRPDAGCEALVLATFVSGEVALGLGAILAFAGRLDIPLDSGQRIDRETGIAAVGAIAVLPYLWRQFTRGTYLQLSPSGFEICQGGPAADGRWDEVNDITDKVPGRRVQHPSAIAMALSDGKTPALFARSFTPNDGHALRRMVRFYWQHPELRDELTDGQAGDRLRGDRFDA